ncbi:MAG: tRNA (adenosine(37)-N6)-threonylcarbamoyltransferase complex dimerization subunit type 1 TsaB [Clostridiales bacterium]|nr:tRNA (adenosine(37)-N6)-threonylcarbamoyltransferase complex dimerization subunit type 1 TsaB [Clostridiales bacterium]
MKLLAIDTSSAVASTALLDGDRIVFEGNLRSGMTHSRNLMPLIESAMNLAAWRPMDLEALAVTCGPGSFTGLRIGVATVKGMARALHIPVAAVSTLNVLAAGCGIFDGLIVPVMDARRDQVYTATFAGGQNLERLTPDRAIGLKALIAELSRFDQPTLFAGDGVEPYGSTLTAALGGQAHIAPPTLRMQRAAVAGLLGAAMIAAGEMDDPRTLAPRYLRGTMAVPVWERSGGKRGNG